jgi:hypothetical protein
VLFLRQGILALVRACRYSGGMSTRRTRHRDLTKYALAVAEPTIAPGLDFPATARWAGPIGMEDELTGDGRGIQGGALRWEVTDDNRPPIRYVAEDVGMHDGAVTVGNFDLIERREGGVIWAEGDFDMASEAGREAYRMVNEKRQNGVSMDLDDVSFEIRVAAELVEEMNAVMEGDGDIEVPVPNEDGTVTVVTINSSDEIMLTTNARIRSATIVAIPAFANARISIVDGPEEDAAEVDASPHGSDELAVSAIVAASATLLPPRAWTENPNLSEPTALTITPEGRVFGHLALWGTCHLSHSAGGQCVSPPNSASDYAWFHTGALETAEGDLVAVGHLTMGTGHAGDKMGPAETLSHYDNTGTVAADVRAYEDQFGIVVAGALRSNLTPEQVRAFRAAPLSGDWRRVGYALELVAALSVNVPGFGVPRPAGLVAGGNLVSLVASGIIVPVTEESASTLSSNDLAYLRSFIDREKRAELTSLAARRNKVKVAAFARRSGRNH